MKILLVEPGQYAREAEIPHTLEAMQRTVGGTITATYPYGEPVAVVCNDEGLLLGLPFNRRLDDNTIIAGTFFICGLSEDNFADLSPELMKKFKKRLYWPQQFIRIGQMLFALPCAPKEGGGACGPG